MDVFYHTEPGQSTKKLFENNETKHKLFQYWRHKYKLIKRISRKNTTIACLCPDNGVALTPDIHRIGCCYFYIVLTGIVRHSLDNVS